MQHPPQFRIVKESPVGILRERLGSRGDIFLRRSNTGKFNDTYFVEGAELARPLVVRVAPPDDRGRMLFYEHRMMRQEPMLHRLLRKNTSMPVPEILHFEEQNEVLQRDVMVMERMPGEPMVAGHDALLHELGGKLREVHDSIRADPGAYGYLGEHRPMRPQKTWQDAFRVMWHSLIDDIDNCNGGSAEEIKAWREKFDEYEAVFAHYEAPASLLHMDVWAENILSDSSGRLTGLIDWDRVLWGDPEIEFAVLEYCGISTPAFWRGYGKMPPSTRDAGIRRVFYLLYEVLKYIVIRIARQGNAGGAERYRMMARQLLEQI